MNTSHEPPTADPHGGWCGGWGLETPGYPIGRHCSAVLVVMAVSMAHRSVALQINREQLPPSFLDVFSQTPSRRFSGRLSPPANPALTEPARWSAVVVCALSLLESARRHIPCESAWHTHNHCSSLSGMLVVSALA